MGRATRQGRTSAPFPLNYIEVGNEDNFDRTGSYDARYTQFYDAIKAKHPNLQIIATTRVTTRTPDLTTSIFTRIPKGRWKPAPTNLTITSAPARKFSSANGPRASAPRRRTWRARSATPRG